jgi:hypothetical protein
MTQLSPQAQAVLNALLEAKFGKEAVELGFPVMSVILGRELAAALRAAVQELAYEIHCPGEGWYELVIDANDLHAIATELEGA